LPEKFMWVVGSDSSLKFLEILKAVKY